MEQQDYLPIRARQSTLFPDYPTALCATLTTQESTQWGLNPVAGEWTGTTGSWMDAARRGEAAEVLDRYRELAF